MARRYQILDVFTEDALSGNPLAVVLDGQGLSDAEMQKIACEFNLSETTFVSPAVNPAASARVRIFTPEKELNFAGHPTVGTAVVLAAQRLEGSNGEQREAMVVLEENVGLVRCGVVFAGGKPGRAKFVTPRLPEELPGTLDKGAIAQALGLNKGDIGFENHLPTFWHAGGPSFVFVPLKDQAAVSAARIVPDYWAQAFGAGVDAYIYCREPVVHGRHFHSRCFLPGVGVPEDPATGSAVAAFAGVITRFDEPLDGTHGFEIEQGFAMGRPSVISLELVIAKGQLTQARIAGSAVVVAEGQLHL